MNSFSATLTQTSPVHSNLRRLVRAAVPSISMPGAVQEYRQLLLLGSGLATHLMVTLSPTDVAHASVEGLQQQQQQPLGVGAEQHSLEAGSSTSWLPYLLASHHLIQSHGASAAAASVSTSFVRSTCNPAKAHPLDSGCGPLQIQAGGDLSDRSADPLLHLARQLQQQQQQGQATGCSSSISLSSSFGGPDNNSSSGAGVAPGRLLRQVGTFMHHASQPLHMRHKCTHAYTHILASLLRLSPVFAGLHSLYGSHTPNQKRDISHTCVSPAP